MKIPMEIDVYDTFASSKKGNTIHFDVLLTSGGKKETASKYAMVFLKKLVNLLKRLTAVNFAIQKKQMLSLKSRYNQMGTT